MPTLPGNAWAPSRRDAVEAQGRGGDERPFREAEAGPAVRIATGSAGPVGDVPPAEDQGRHAGERRPARLSANPASECAPFRPGAVPPRPWFGDPGSATLARRRGRRASRRSPAPRARRSSSPAAIVSASRHHRRDQAERRPRALRCRDGRVRLAVAWLPDRGDAPARSWFTTRSNATSVLGPGSVTGTLRRPCPDGAAWLARVPGAQAFFRPGDSGAPSRSLMSSVGVDQDTGEGQFLPLGQDNGTIGRATSRRAATPLARRDYHEKRMPAPLGGGRVSLDESKPSPA